MTSAETREIFEKVRQVEIRTNRLARDTFAGQYHSVFKGRGMDFDEVREYVPGDEIRSIDWNVTARTGRPFVKKYREERELTILLLVDLSASGHFGSTAQSKRERAAEVASVLAFSAIRNNDKVGLILFTDEIEQYLPPKKGRRHVLRVVREILFFTPRRRGTDLVQALRFAHRVVRRHAIAFLLSDFLVPGEALGRGEELRRALQLVHRRHDLVALRVGDRRESELPRIGRVTLEDAETGEQLEIDTGDENVRQRFAEQADARRRALRQLFGATGIDALDIDTQDPYLAPLRRFFRTRAARRG
ncbi:MAG: DUF58 domain-containing protein [Deltaproteobacteria bacterium]|nr:DUF58 domain-containing protein [Deltaproteobacteria bacterium]